MNLYLKFGVEEYWIVRPGPPALEVYSWTESGYMVAGAYCDYDKLSSPAFPELNFELTEVFGPPEIGRRKLANTGLPDRNPGLRL